MQTITANVLTYNEFDKLVREHLGLVDFECVATFEWNNDEDHLCTDIRDEPEVWPIPSDSLEKATERYVRELREVEDFMKEQETHGTGPYQILQYLCYHGHIKPGNYLIRVSW